MTTPQSLQTLDAEEGDVVCCSNVGVLPQHFTVGKHYVLGEGPTITTNLGKVWGEGPEATSAFPFSSLFYLVARNGTEEKERFLARQEQGKTFFEESERLADSIPVLLRDMDPEEVSILLQLSKEKLQVWNWQGWWEDKPGEAFFSELAYRIKPGPEPETAPNLTGIYTATFEVLSVRAFNVLSALNPCMTFEDFMALDKSTVMKQKNAGRRTWQEIVSLQTRFQQLMEETPEELQGLKNEIRLAGALKLLSELEKTASECAYGSDHIICHNCAKTAEKISSFLTLNTNSEPTND